LIKLTCLPCYFQAHPWFEGTEWDKLYQMKAAFIPEVNDELDTQNFEKFEEVD
jgi:serine/threonine kinase 38